MSRTDRVPRARLGGGGGEVIARLAWRSGAYFVSRGLAKSGSRELYWDGGTNEHSDGGRPAM
ncbi:MAG TPA: hypothetical protein VNA28_07255 [Solirubrobacteraceae bacterium]|nr:hypothetical protein [Solirubrobacteraceae bacterium]